MRNEGGDLEQAAEETERERLRELAVRRNVVSVYASTECAKKIKHRDFNGPVQHAFGDGHLSEPRLGGSTERLWTATCRILGAVMSRERFTKALKTRLMQKTMWQWILSLGHFGPSSILHKKADNFEASNKNRFQVLRMTDWKDHFVFYNVPITPEDLAAKLLPGMKAVMADLGERQAFCTMKAMPWKGPADMLPTVAEEKCATDVVAAYLDKVLAVAAKGGSAAVHHTYDTLDHSNIQPTPGTCPESQSVMLDPEHVNLADKRTAGHMLLTGRYEFVEIVLRDKLKGITGVEYDPGTNIMEPTSDTDATLRPSLPDTADGWREFNKTFRKPSVKIGRTADAMGIILVLAGYFLSMDGDPLEGILDVAATLTEASNGAFLMFDIVWEQDDGSWDTIETPILQLHGGTDFHEAKVQLHCWTKLNWNIFLEFMFDGEFGRTTENSKKRVRDPTTDPKEMWQELAVLLLAWITSVVQAWRVHNEYGKDDAEHTPTVPELAAYIETRAAECPLYRVFVTAMSIAITLKAKRSSSRVADVDTRESLDNILAFLYAAGHATCYMNLHGRLRLWRERCSPLVRKLFVRFITQQETGFMSGKVYSPDLSTEKIMEKARVIVGDVAVPNMHEELTFLARRGNNGYCLDCEGRAPNRSRAASTEHGTETFVCPPLLGLFMNKFAATRLCVVGAPLHVGGEDRGAGSLVTLSGEPLSPRTLDTERIGTDRMAKIHARNLFGGPPLEANLCALVPATNSKGLLEAIMEWHRVHSKSWSMLCYGRVDDGKLVDTAVPLRDMTRRTGLLFTNANLARMAWTEVDSIARLKAAQDMDRLTLAKQIAENRPEPDQETFPTPERFAAAELAEVREASGGVGGEDRTMYERDFFAGIMAKIAAPDPAPAAGAGSVAGPAPPPAQDELNIYTDTPDVLASSFLV